MSSEIYHGAADGEMPPPLVDQLFSGKLLQYSGMARDAGVSVDTARRYMGYLRVSWAVPSHRLFTR